MVRKVPAAGHLFKNRKSPISSNCLTSQLPEVEMLVGANRRLTRILGNLRNERSIGGFLKFQHIPRNLLSIRYFVGLFTAQERPGNALISHLWLTLRIYTSKS